MSHSGSSGIMERYFYVFSSIFLHQHVMETNKAQIGGNWAGMLHQLETLGRDILTEYGVDRNTLQGMIEDMTLTSASGSIAAIRKIFPSAVKVQADTTPAP